MSYVASSATVTKDGTVVRIHAGDDVSIIKDKSLLAFNDQTVVTIIKAYKDSSGNQFIQLELPWPYPTQTNKPLIVVPTSADHYAAVIEIRRIIDTLQVASTAEAVAGENASKIMTPKSTKAALSSYVAERMEEVGNDRAVQAAVAAIYSIPENDIFPYPTSGAVTKNSHYIYKRAGVAEVWKANTILRTHDPANGDFTKLTVQTGGGGGGSVAYGNVPLNYVSGPLHIIVDGVLSPKPYTYVDSYTPISGDEVIIVNDIVVGVVALDEPLMESFCKYYGYPISINGAWDVEEAAKFFSGFDGVVWGDNIGNPEHVTNADTRAIISVMKGLNPRVKIFGYVPIGLDPEWQDSNLTLAELYVKIDNWKATGATHIFLDEYGYDYFVDRERQNACVSYCKSLGMNVCANSWSADYCFSNKNIVLEWANNFEGNPTLLPCLLGADDYLQFENVVYKYQHIPGTEGYRNPEQWVNNNQRIIDMYEYMYGAEEEYGGRSYFDVYGTRGYALDAIINYDKKMYSESYLIALASGMHAHAASVAFWGAVTSTYPQYEKPHIRAATRAALGEARVEAFDGRYVGRLTTQIGPDEIEVTWVQNETEIKFSEASLAEGLKPLKHIMAVDFPEGTTITGAGYFTLTLGDSNDDQRTLSVAVAGTETLDELLDKILAYDYPPIFLATYDVSREGNRILFTTAEPYTEELTTWWVWHTPGILSTTVDKFTVVQKGTDGKSLEYREVRVNKVAVDYGFGPYWRKPRQVPDGYTYFDTTNNRNIVFRGRVWYDMAGNKADASPNPDGVAAGFIAMYFGEGTPDGWALCDGLEGRPLVAAGAYPYYVKLSKEELEIPAG